MIIGPCTVVTGGLEPAVLEDAAVRVIGAHIAQVGPAGSIAAASPDDTLWPARGRVLMPGLVNTHIHLGRHLARGLGLRSTADWERYDAALSPEDVYWAAMSSLAEGVRHGVTTVCDFHRSAGCLERALPEVVAAAAKVGVRVATCYGADEHDTPDLRRAALEESAGFARDLARKRHGRWCGLVGARATTLSGVERLMQDSLEAAGDSVGVHLELALDSTPGERWSGGIWSPGAMPSLWAHADLAPRALLGAMVERGDTVTAQGAAATSLARETGLGWGSDTGVNAPPVPDPAQMWGSEARTTEAHYRRLFVNGADWAARLFGRGLGTITPGAPADLVLIDYRPATEFSARTVHEHLWSGLLRAPMSGAMVSGDIVVDNGHLVTMDEREIAQRARECARRVWERVS